MRKESGVGILELLVGMFVGILVLLSAMGSLSYYQSVQRNSMSGNSALANAVSGLYLIGNDLRLAGLGLTVGGQMACSSLNASYNGTTTSNGGLMAPVSIADNNGVTPDVITVMYGDTIYSGAPATLLTAQASPSGSFSIPLAAGSQMGTAGLLAVPGSTLPCTLVGVSSVNTSGSTAVVTLGGAPYNPANPAGAYSNAVTYSTAGYFLNLNLLHWDTWSIVNNVLQVQDNMTGIVQTIADNVVQMHAEYGVTNGVSPGISQWVRATGTWTPLTSTLIPQIVAVRIAIVSRSTQPQKPNSAGVCNTTTTPPVTWTGSPSMSLASNANWMCYRYRVLRMVFPLKNIVWGG